MTRSETVIVAFVASPSDVEDERNKLEEVVRELNLTWSKTLGARIDLVRWETHAYPAAGQDPQDVINRQIGDDYDIFVGIMWGRFGSPTERADSGTEEEFRRAWTRYETDGSVRIMFYFKDAPIAPSKLDPQQLERIQSFKSEIGDEGLLHWSFQTVEEFEGLLRLHFARQMQTFQSTRDANPADESTSSPARESAAIEEDSGILDLMDTFEERLQTVNEIVTRIASATEELGDRMNQRTNEIRDAVDRTDVAMSRADAKKLVNRAADDMDQYVTRAGAEIPIFREALREGIDALGRATTLSADLDEGDLSKVREGRHVVAILETELHSALESMSQFRNTIHSLPRMTTRLSKAKRSTLGILDELLQGLRDGRRDASEAGKALDAILETERDA